MTNKYSSQYLDPRWQKKRLEVMQRDEFKCRDCGDADSQLHVHHLMYFKNRMVWDYDDKLLVCLCDSCHVSRHSNNETEHMLSEILISGIDTVYVNMITHMYARESKLVENLIQTMFDHIHTNYRHERGLE